MRTLAWMALAAMSSTSTCNAQPGLAPAPAPVVAPAPPPPPVQNPDDCSTACAQAQSACTNPLDEAHCVAVCEAAAKNLSAPGIDCIAKVTTCNVECK